jgi:hypothetical protein
MSNLQEATTGEARSGKDLKSALRASLVYAELRAGFAATLTAHDALPASGTVAALAFRDALTAHLEEGTTPNRAGIRAGQALIEAVKGTISPAALASAVHTARTVPNLPSRAAWAWMQASSGRPVNLLDPDPDEIDFDVDIAEGLARCARFAGAIRSGPYSDAQHSVLGADWIWERTHDPVKAAAFLVHDAHEALITDGTTPVLDTKVEIARREFVKDGYDPGYMIKAVSRTLKRNLDAAIYPAAGLPWPLPDDIKALVAEVDLRMLKTERMFLMAPPQRAWDPMVEAAEPLRIPRDRFRIWPWPKAADEFRDRLRRWCPAALGARPANHTATKEIA